jgi:hypothetical protein
MLPVLVQVGLGAIAGAGVIKKMIAPAPQRTVSQLPTVGIGRSAYVQLGAVNWANGRHFMANAKNLLRRANAQWTAGQYAAASSSFMDAANNIRDAYLSAGALPPAMPLNGRNHVQITALLTSAINHYAR